MGGGQEWVGVVCVGGQIERVGGRAKGGEVEMSSGSYEKFVHSLCTSPFLYLK